MLHSQNPVRLWNFHHNLPTGTENFLNINWYKLFLKNICHCHWTDDKEVNCKSSPDNKNTPDILKKSIILLSMHQSKFQNWTFTNKKLSCNFCQSIFQLSGLNEWPPYRREWTKSIPQKRSAVGICTENKKWLDIGWNQILKNGLKIFIKSWHC